MKFFFDTADTNYIKKVWEKFQHFTDGKSVCGITTNPNAFHKVGLLKLQEWYDKTRELCELTASIRGDECGEVFIQFPSSYGSITELEKFVNLTEKFNKGLKSGSYSKIGVKIPPFQKFLEFARVNNFISNVTGLSDCGTALKVLNYRVNWISLIPGRMESVGIDFETQLGFLQGAAEATNTKIITGSMRTVDGLIKCIRYNTVPTIGSTVFNLIDEEDRYKEVVESCDLPIKLQSRDFCPPIDETNRVLSENFFIQMDECGKQAYEDFKNL
jgi:hypothetical protein